MASSESAIWQSAHGHPRITPVAGTLVRLVESQEHVATNRLVASLQAQAILEELLETSKPAVPKALPRRHYLLATPFRYPPLRHGSRFGSYHEPSLFYGSTTVPTVLAEAAYYRFVFWYGMTASPSRPMKTQHILFSAHYSSQFGVKLQQPPFARWQATLTSRLEYGATQALGTAMRKAGVEAFEFVSARDPQAGLNVALFCPAALPDPEPKTMQSWLAETASHRVGFFSAEAATFQCFDLGQFLVDGALPTPAV